MLLHTHCVKTDKAIKKVITLAANKAGVRRGQLHADFVFNHTEEATHFFWVAMRELHPHVVADDGINHCQGCKQFFFESGLQL